MKKLKSMVRGFTLIELLIVLAVIAALLAIVTPIALNAVRQANLTRIASTMRNIRAAAESYIYTERPATPTSVTLQELHNKGYINQIPEDFTLTFTPWTNNEATGTVYYSQSIDATALKVIYPDAQPSGTGAKVEFRVAKYW
ncbi:MAG: type II secretion system GspH family protein [Pseudothermotoga sp.]|nr:type II secretion system GspH family protein [Pseudothermotoga sp.]